MYSSTWPQESCPLLWTQGWSECPFGGPEQMLRAFGGGGVPNDYRIVESKKNQPNTGPWLATPHCTYNALPQVHCTLHHTHHTKFIHSGYVFLPSSLMYFHTHDVAAIGKDWKKVLFRSRISVQISVFSTSRTFRMFGGGWATSEYSPASWQSLWYGTTSPLPSELRSQTLFCLPHLNQRSKGCGFHL